MKTLPRRLRRPDPVVFVVLTLLCAAVLVVYLQHRALRALDRQTGLILEKISEQAAEKIADDVRATLEGPVFDTLTAVNHPELRAGPLELIARHYEEGLRKYPHVERFFVWNSLTEARAPGEVLFFGPRPRLAAAASEAGIVPSTWTRVPLPLGLDDFWRDPGLGAFIHRAARASAESQQIYSAVETEFDGKAYDIFVRLFWTDAAREEYFALLGFVVCVETAPMRLFPELHRRRFAAQLNPGPSGPRLEMRVVDEQGRTLFGPSGPAPAIVGRASFSARFYPDQENRSRRLAAQVPPREWTVLVAPVSEQAPAVLAAAGPQGYWLSGLSVLLILAALMIAVKSQKRADQLARMQTEFVSHVSHQLKTPLSLLAAVTETLTLERVRSPEKVAQYVDIMRDETERLSSLVERILDFSRVDSRDRRYEIEAVPLAPLVRETTEVFAQKVAQRGFSVRVQETGEAGVVAADPAAIEQVLVNLLDNAVKYSDGARDVTVRVGRAGPEAVVEVVDRGIGSAPADQAHIFERFYRGAGATPQRPGFGLGLAIVDEIVTAHAGRVEVESTPGRGSTFRVRLPVLRDEAGALAAVKGSTRRGRVADPASSSRSA